MIDERIIIKIMQEEGFPYKFWHEYNSLRFIDDIETARFIVGGFDEAYERFYKF